MLRRSTSLLGGSGKFNQASPLYTGATQYYGPVGRLMVPFNAYVGHMLKDIAGRLTVMSHRMRSNRLMYPVPRHSNLRMYRHMAPDYHFALWVAPTAAVTGNVVLSSGSIVAYHACIRNYHTRQQTIIGDNSAVLERATLIGQVRVGSECIISPGVTLDCCEVHNNVYIGPRAHVALGCIIENGAILAAGAVVPKDTRVPAGELWAGNPAQKVGVVSAEQASEVQHQVQDLQHAAELHRDAFEQHVAKNTEFDAQWLRSVCEQIEQRQSAIQIARPTDMDVPPEARQFMMPRVRNRRPTEHIRVGTPTNKNAPWLPKLPDWTGNV